MRRVVVAWAAALIVSSGLLALPIVAFAATSAVNIQGFAYSPTPLTIKVGDTVTWTNRDSAQHSARFAGLGTGTAVLSQGQSGSLTFNSAGTFNYDCAVHGSAMQGTVVVQAPTPAPTPPPTQPPTARPTPPPTAPPTPVRTAPPTTAATVPPTVAPTEAPTAPATTVPPSPTATASTTTETPTQSASPSTVAAQLTPLPTASSGPGLVPIGAVLAVVLLGGLAFFLMRRS